MTQPDVDFGPYGKSSEHIELKCSEASERSRTVKVERIPGEESKAAGYSDANNLRTFT